MAPGQRQPVAAAVRLFFIWLFIWVQVGFWLLSALKFPLRVLIKYIFIYMQIPPPPMTQEKKDDDDEGSMPPYEQETQNLIDGVFIWPLT